MSKRRFKYEITKRTDGEVCWFIALAFNQVEAVEILSKHFNPQLYYFEYLGKEEIEEK